MAQIISIHSFRGGTGKSNTTANLAALLVAQGKRVGVIDTDIQSPGIHILFGLSGEHISRSLNDYLWGLCPIEEAAYNVTKHIYGDTAVTGEAYLIPSSMQAGEIARILRDGYNVGLLADGLQQMISALALDVLLIDTHPGLGEETLLSMVMSHTVLIIMRPDEQDCEGTGVTVKVAQRLEVAQMQIVVNKTPTTFDPAQVQAQVKRAYGCPVAAVIPHSDLMMGLASRRIFVVAYPEHPITALYAQVAQRCVVS